MSNIHRKHPVSIAVSMALLAAAAPVRSAGKAVVAAASNAMDTAIDTGCLRCRFDTGFTSRLFSSNL